MRPIALSAALAMTLGAFATSPALAYDYGVFSGRGFNDGYVIAPGLRRCNGFPVFRSGEVPPGTAANPMPVCGPAAVFRLHPSVIYNAPPAASDLYRVVPLR